MSESLAFTAAACQLAREVFMARKAAYGLDDAWQSLSIAQRNIYVRQAADILKAHAPSRTKVIAFIGPPPTRLHQVNHRDANKRNNVVTNLEWVTKSQNAKHAHALGLMPSFKEEGNRMSTAIAERETSAPVTVKKDEIDLIKATVANGATDAELRLFLFDCQRQNVHPLDRLIHFTKRSGKYTPITSIDFMRIRAADTGEYAGSDDVAFIYRNGTQDPPETATVTVWRLVQGHRCPFQATARWTEYKPEQNDFMWRKMPHTMLGKCAEALALRKGFPRQLAGLYAKEEMDQAGTDSHTPIVTAPTVSAPASQSLSGAESLQPSAPNGGDSGVSVPPGFDLIVEVRPSRAGSKGEIVMRSGESFLFYKEKLKTPAMEWCQNRIPVQLTIKKSTSGNKYIDDIHPLPQPITDADLDAELAAQTRVVKSDDFAF